MKKELPIAACLLALGGALCFNFSSPLPSQASSGNSIEAIAKVLADDVTDEPAATFLNISRAAGGQEDLWCKSTLVEAGRALNALPAFAVRTQLECDLHDTRLLSDGKYFQAEGGHHARLELVFNDAKSPFSVLQICDGQFAYTLRSSGQQQRLEFVDLGRLENKDAGLSALALPSSWVMGGGLGSTVMHYAEAFHFRLMGATDPNKFQVRGVWDTRILANLLFSDVEVAKRPVEVVLEKLPAHMPHGIELSFSKRASDVMQPEKIVFFRFKRQQGRAVAAPMMQIEFETLQVSQSLPPALFTIESSGFEAVEMTDVYNQKIRELNVGLPKVATAPEQHVR